MPNNLLNVCLFVLKLDTNGLLTHFIAAAVANNKINMYREKKIKNKLKWWNTTTTTTEKMVFAQAIE